MPWTDEDEKKFREWHLKHYGVEPPEVKMKEVDMKEVTMVNKKIEEFMGTGANPENTLMESKPLVKRTRRPRGTAPGIEVITTRTAIIRLHFPDRPVGMEKVIIKIFEHESEWPESITVMEWPKGITALKAIEAHFANQKGA